MHSKDDISGSGKPSDPDYTNPEFFKTTSGDEFHCTREQNTLDWVFNHPELLVFCKSKNNEIMCLEGDPGCGKSVCTKSLVSEHVFDAEDRLVCACFITKNCPEEQTAARALQSLLYQIFTAHPALLSIHASDKIKNVGRSILSCKESLWDILISVISDPAIGKQIVLLIDGVDESDDPSWFFSKIESLWVGIKTEKDARVKLFYTATLASLNIKQLRVIQSQDYVNNISFDLEALSNSYLQSCNFSTTNNLNISQAFAMLRQQNSNYLAFNLFRPEIEKQIVDKPRPHQVKFLSSMPKTLDQVYNRLVKEYDSDDLFRVLCIVFGAAEPLILEEFSVAFAVSSGMGYHGDIRQKQPRQFDQFLAKTCGPLVKVVGNKVYLTHDSLRDYLLCVRKHGRPAKFTNVKKECHNVLSAACVAFLNLKDVKSNCGYTGKSLPTSKKRKLTGSTTPVDSMFFCFFKYTARYWLQHFRHATKHTSKDNEILQDLCTPQKVGEIPHLLQMCPPHNREITKLAAEIKNLIPQNCLTEESKTILSLYIAAWLGLDAVLKHMLPTRWGQKIPPAPGTNLAQTYINRAPRKGYLPPLGIATKNRHFASVELLLKGETVPLEYDMAPHFSLQLSVDLDWTSLFQYAFQLPDKEGGKASSRIEKQYADQLKAAAASGKLEYIEGLLSKGPKRDEFNLQSVYSSTLYAAFDADEPNIGIVEQLLDHGADANYRAKNQETILEAAAQHEEPKLVIALLRAGASPNIHSNCGKRWYEYDGMEDAAKEAGFDIVMD
ncbi:uncharacterized protein TRUGW13939_01341 [Talaromyces rugulosus]|uniref:Nephrocystin 3-like N-terminal domain-containing protein n=1 Tax=Talaromyces rugulosus TaxID=121627 RepID=A0A7H8QK34_TALRU|nr:uncharacterized protein TRUGW13939_01341 [Talaromyces rugulosus]QKX54256.1 hypothetical protein TRUGW13939_01341 [Talaromyces rugulosus]